MRMDEIRPLYSSDAEQALIGGVLNRPDAFDDVADIVVEDDLFLLAHREIWRAMGEMVNAGQPFDAITLAEHMQRAGNLDDVGGLEYIGGLQAGISSSANVKRYAQVVADYSSERRLLRALNESMETMTGRGNTADKVEEVAVKVGQAAEMRQRGEGPSLISNSLGEWLETVENRFDNKGSGQITGIRTGYADLDAITHGLQGGNLVVIAGRPSMGKSLLAQNICEHIAIEENKPAVFFSMEMTKGQILDRAAASIGRVRMEGIQSGDIHEDEFPRITSATIKLNEAKFFVDDTPALTPMELRARVRKLKRTEDIGLVVIDYLQMMRVPGYKNDKVHEIEEISRSMKSMAKELDIPVVLLSQLNRSVEARQDKRPIMSDLRESGAIEQDADIIVFVYREDQYRDENDSERSNVAELLVRKNRQGKTGTVKLVTNFHIQRFDSFDGRQYEPMSMSKSPAKKGFDG